MEHSDAENRPSGEGGGANMPVEGESSANGVTIKTEEQQEQEQEQVLEALAAAGAADAVIKAEEGAEEHMTNGAGGDVNQSVVSGEAESSSATSQGNAKRKRDGLSDDVSVDQLMADEESLDESTKQALAMIRQWKIDHFKDFYALCQKRHLDPKFSYEAVQCNKEDIKKTGRSTTWECVVSLHLPGDPVPLTANGTAHKKQEARYSALENLSLMLLQRGVSLDAPPAKKRKSTAAAKRQAEAAAAAGGAGSGGASGGGGGIEASAPADSVDVQAVPITADERTQQILAKYKQHKPKQLANLIYQHAAEGNTEEAINCLLVLVAGSHTHWPADFATLWEAFAYRGNLVGMEMLLKQLQNPQVVATQMERKPDRMRIEAKMFPPHQWSSRQEVDSANEQLLNGRFDRSDGYVAQHTAAAQGHRIDCNADIFMHPSKRGGVGKKWTQASSSASAAAAAAAASTSFEPQQYHQQQQVGVDLPEVPGLELSVEIVESCLDVLALCGSPTVAEVGCRLLGGYVCVPMEAFRFMPAWCFYTRFRLLLAEELCQTIYQLTKASTQGNVFCYGPLRRRHFGNSHSLMYIEMTHAEGRTMADYPGPESQKICENEYVRVVCSDPHIPTQVGFVKAADHKGGRVCLYVPTVHGTHPKNVRDKNEQATQELAHTFTLWKIANRKPFDAQIDALKRLCNPVPNVMSISLQDQLLARQPPPQVHEFQNRRSQVMNFLGNVLRNVWGPLNHSQIEAVGAAASSELTLIQGPAGTGKTTVAATIIKAWTYDRQPAGKILAVAGSSVAADNLKSILQDIDDIHKDHPINALRVGSGSSFDSADDLAYQAAKEMTRAGNPQSVKNLLSASLRDAKVIVATCVECQANKELAKHTFDRVIVDEATQATEPAVLCAIVRGCRKLVLIGDQQQLPPTVHSLSAADKGLSLPLFQRLLLCGHRPYMLHEQYRMHPAVAEFPNGHFYNRFMSDAVHPSERPVPQGFPWPQPYIPVCFIDTSGGVFEEQVDTSFKNRREASEAVRALDMMLGWDVHLFDQYGKKRFDIGLVTPYQEQRRELLRQLLAYIHQTPKLYHHVKSMVTTIHDVNKVIDVDTVDGFQGMEREVIIFSAVRSNSQGDVGLLGDHRRTNNMLTRAKRGLIVIGDRNTLSADGTWRAFIDWATHKGCVRQAYPIM